jgi:molybdopterin synthase catalytic subunit
MRITIRLFAMQRQQLGWKQLPFELPDGSTIEQAWTELVRGFPDLGPAGGSIRFARNGVYAERSERLADGDELALIPPVAGGARSRRIELWDTPLPDELESELRRAIATTADGAVVSFVGRTRETPGTPAPGETVPEGVAGQVVEGLAYEAFEPMALAVLDQIADEIGERFGVEGLAIVHRTGEVPLGEASVLIVAAAEHRAAAFDACRYAIEELKARAPIWKQERYRDGSVWVGAPARHGAEPTDPAAPEATG